MPTVRKSGLLYGNDGKNSSYPSLLQLDSVLRSAGILGGGGKYHRNYISFAKVHHSYISTWHTDGAPEYNLSNGDVERQWRAEFNACNWELNSKDSNFGAHKTRYVARGDQESGWPTSVFQHATKRVWSALAKVAGWMTHSSYKAHIYFTGHI